MLQFTGQAKDLDSTVTPVVNWGAVIAGGLKAGADIAKTQADTRVDELRAQSIQAGLPIIAEQSAAAQRRLDAEMMADKLIGKTKRAEIMVETIRSDEETANVVAQEKLAKAKQGQLISGLRSQFTDPSKPLFGVYAAAQNGLTSGLLTDRDAGYDALMEAVKSNPTIGLIPEVAEMQAKYMQTGEGITVLPQDPSKPNLPSVSWTEARRTGVYKNTPMQMLAGQKLEAQRQREQIIQDTTTSLRNAGVPEAEIPAHVGAVVDYKDKVLKLDEALSTRMIGLQKQLDTLIVNQNGEQVLDAPKVMSLRDELLSNTDLNRPEIKTIIDGVADPVLKEQLITTFQASNANLQIKMLDALDAKVNAQDVAVKLKSTREREQAGVVLSNGHTDFKTFFARAKGDGRNVRENALQVAATTARTYLLTINNALEKIDPADEETRGAYIKSKVQLQSLIDTIDPQLGVKWVNKKDPGYQEGRKSGDAIDEVLSGWKWVFPQSEADQEKWIRSVHSEIQKSLPSSLPSQVVRDNFAPNFRASLAEQRALLTQQSEVFDSKLQALSQRTGAKVNPAGLKLK